MTLNGQIMDGVTEINAGRAVLLVAFLIVNVDINDYICCHYGRPFFEPSVGMNSMRMI
jgi:hypothetical protein